MTDRAINFQEVVAAVRATGDAEATIVTVDGDGPIDVCQALYEELDGRTDQSACEFYMSPNVRREMERRLIGDDVAVADEAFLERQIRTDVSMPDDAILFANPDGITLGGTVTGEYPVAVGTLTADGDDRK